MQLLEVVDAVGEVAATSSRTAKVQRIAACLSAAPDDALPAVVAWLSGGLRQRRTGFGWASLRDLPCAAPVATLSVEEVDETFERAQTAAGAGSASARTGLLEALFARAVPREQEFLIGLISGDARHGAGAGLLLDAVRVSSGEGVEVVRRAAMLTGDPARVLLLVRHAGPESLSRLHLQVGCPVSPMLAASAPSLAEALAKTGPCGVEWKLDGVRVQLHRDRGLVQVFTRTLEDVTSRVPEVVAAVLRLPATQLVADGEVLSLRPDGRPEPFQVSASRVARHDRDVDAEPLRLVLFDLLSVAGRDLLASPGQQRRAELEALLVAAPLLDRIEDEPHDLQVGAPPAAIVPRLDVVDPDDARQVAAAEEFAAEALRRGHEGVVVKALAAPYAMGRRGAGWVKVKPRLTLDLVVTAVEWGHGRRTGLLSNLHLAARDPQGRFGPPGGPVMLGKTFKGLTDAMLRWQTDALRDLAVHETAHRVDVRPDLVVEIAFDGVQTSTRYPGGVALRFARVVAHRPDKPAAEADTIDTVLALRERAATGVGTTAATVGDR